MQKSLMSATGILLLAGILILVNGISKHVFTTLSLDLTEEGLYSLSEGSKNILASQEDPITLRLYFSKTDSARFPAIGLYGKRILNLLQTYERNSDGNIQLEVYDPRPDSEDEEWAQKYGITAIPTRTGERVFLGLAGVNSDGDEEVIPVFDLGQQNFIEYEVTKLIYKLSQKKLPKLAVLSSLDIQGGAPDLGNQGLGNQGSQKWFFLEQLSQIGDVTVLDSENPEIGKDYALLVVVHPKDLSDKTLYEIDQHVMSGGKLLVLTDPYCEAEPSQQAAQPGMPVAKSSSLNRLLTTWGVEMLDKKAVADRNLATQVNTGNGDLRPFVLWLNLHRDNINKKDIVTSQLEDVLMPWAGALSLREVEGVSVEPLLTSTSEAMQVSEVSYIFQGGQPDQLIRQYSVGKDQQILAVRIRGNLKSNFPEGEPNTNSAEKDEESDSPMSSLDNLVGHLAESVDEANIVVVADVDFIANRFSLSATNFFGNSIVTLRNGNLVFFLNAAENLLGSSDLIGIRSRGRFSRPFTKVLELEHQAEQKWRQEEMVFQAKVNSANQRLARLQSSGSAAGNPSGSQRFDKTVLEEIQKLRDERSVAQKNLRGVRRNLRQEKERLGDWLFMLNVFLVPILLILSSVVLLKSRQRKNTGN